MADYNLVADVSSHQPSDLGFFQALKNAGVKAVIIKLTEGSRDGSNYINPKAAEQIRNTVKCGMLVHAYHYAKFNGIQDAQNEADFFCSVAKQMGLDQTSVMALDIEDHTQQYWATADARAFLQRVIDRGYPHVDLYTMASWCWTGRIAFSKLGIPVNRWIANYGAKQPGVDNVGTWQWTSTFAVYGCKIDMSYDFKGYYTKPLGSSSTPEPSKPVEIKPQPIPNSWKDELGVTWYKEDGKFTVTAPEGIVLRWGATTKSTKIAVLPKGSVVKYDAFCHSGGYVWIRQPRGNGQHGYLPTGESKNGKRISYWGKFSE